MTKKEREKAIILFALDFLKANLEDLKADDMLDDFGGDIKECEIEEAKHSTY